jgi:hypothetical protein
MGNWEKPLLTILNLCHNKYINRYGIHHTENQQRKPSFCND